VIVRVVPAGSLSTRELARWSEIQRTVPSLASPFFAPEFTSIVAAARDDVSVAVLEVDQRVEGFFPFQRGRLGMGLPVGSILSDYHGVVLPDETNLDARALIRSCGLTTWEFHHVVDSQPAFAPFHRVHAESMQIDLDDGFEPYLQWVQRNHGHSITHLRRKTRKLEREHGTIRFTAHTDDPAVLATMLRWKSAQYTKTGAVDILKQHWIRDVLGLVHRTQSDGFAGLLSIISADEQPVAVHLGLRSGPVCHSWFPAYDPRFAAYSPGERAAGRDHHDRPRERRLRVQTHADESPRHDGGRSRRTPVARGRCRAEQAAGKVAGPAHDDRSESSPCCAKPRRRQWRGALMSGRYETPRRVRRRLNALWRGTLAGSPIAVRT